MTVFRRALAPLTGSLRCPNLNSRGSGFFVFFMPTFERTLVERREANIPRRCIDELTVSIHIYWAFKPRIRPIKGKFSHHNRIKRSGTLFPTWKTTFFNLRSPILPQVQHLMSGHVEIKATCLTSLNCGVHTTAECCRPALMIRLLKTEVCDRNANCLWNHNQCTCLDHVSTLLALQPTG